ncbi:MAG TPA: YgiT-type zinc finger protein [Anaerolineales bacterium]
MIDETRDSFQCTECQAGVMHLRHITYFTWLDEELVTVPNFPAWVCDVCGRREYDARAISWLVTILNPETGKTSGLKRKIRPLLEKRTGTRPFRG